MPRIVETLLTTLNAKGEAHIAPLGLIDDEGSGWIVAPFRPSRTLDNLMVNPFAVASHVDDVRIFAGCITGRRDWPLVPADTVNGVRLESAVSHWELKVDRLTDHEQRPKFHCQIVHSGSHRPWPGFNRAQAAVLELAVLSTRLGMLPPDKVEAELKYLQIAIDKTAGDREHEAWSWLMERIDACRRGDDKATKKN
ncbi:MAG: DUF447 domain-containing protein [Hyphomicrobium sp.]|nr:DUF447 domain-containing protein [Hyphomicrobium sp.]PPD05894.1 MAG: tetrahydromethanopterin synthesis protein [Hyphomicrobium sp.]